MHINRGAGHLRGLQFGVFFSGGLISRGVISGIQAKPTFADAPACHVTLVNRLAGIQLTGVT